MDWPALIADLEASGYGNARTARALNVPLTTLRDWKVGAEPRYSNGEALLLLHSRVFGRQHTENRIKEFRAAALMLSSSNGKGAASHAQNCREGSRPR